MRLNASAHHCSVRWVSIMAVFFAVMLALNVSLANAADQISRAQAMEIATATYPGKVLKVDSKAQHFAVKVLSLEGRVRVLRVDKTTGRLLDSKTKNKPKAKRPLN